MKMTKVSDRVDTLENRVNALGNQGSQSKIDSSLNQKVNKEGLHFVRSKKDTKNNTFLLTTRMYYDS